MQNIGARIRKSVARIVSSEGKMIVVRGVSRVRNGSNKLLEDAELSHGICRQPRCRETDLPRLDFQERGRNGSGVQSS